MVDVDQWVIIEGVLPSGRMVGEKAQVCIPAFGLSVHAHAVCLRVNVNRSVCVCDYIPIDLKIQCPPLGIS